MLQRGLHAPDFRSTVRLGLCLANVRHPEAFSHFAQVEHTFTVSQLTAAQLEEKALSQNPCVLLIFHPQDSHTRQLGGHVSTGFSSLPVITSPKSQPLCPDPSLSSMKIGNMI